MERERVGDQVLMCAVSALGLLLSACGEDASSQQPTTTTTTTTGTECGSEGEQRACWTGDPLTRGIGACRDGTETCSEGRWSGCQGEVSPADEICGDEVDDDCDGIPDEGCACEVGTPPRDCYGGSAATIGIGICRAGEQRCEDGQWVNKCEGEVTPQQETCDGLDNDCDGSADPGCDCTDGTTQPCYAGPPDTEDVGICHAGESICSDGQWTPCSGQVTPGSETCNGADDDCNGGVDDGDPGGGSSCDTGQLGICAPGTRHCQGGTLSCVPHQTPQAEICDGVDQNCNGTLDDGSSLPNTYDSLEWIPDGWFGLQAGAFVTWGDTMAWYDAGSASVTSVSSLQDSWDALSTSGPQPPSSGIDATILVPSGFFGTTEDILFVTAGTSAHWISELGTQWHTNPVSAYFDIATADAVTYFQVGDVPTIDEDFLVTVQNDQVRLHWPAGAVSNPASVAGVFCSNGSTGPCPPGIDSIMRMPSAPWATVVIQHGSTSYSSTFHTNPNGIYYQWSTFQMASISCAH